MKGDRGSEESASSLRGGHGAQQCWRPYTCLAREIVVWITTKAGWKPAHYTVALQRESLCAIS